MSLQIGKYKRPGIFIEEYDKSVISSETTEGIRNLVIGVSRKGPINTPVLITSQSDLASVFGSIDYNLERKGSYFQRTIQKMLDSSAVYGLNLLKTDDELDTIQYKSLSTCVAKSNDDIKEGAYRKFFNTTGFWKRDTEAFINLTKKNDGYENRVLNLTNISDKYITVFVMKSKMYGFDRTLLEWYGNAQKVPTYVNQNDYASDYLVDLVVIGGDWSDYQQLAVDTHWSQYFTTSGLKKAKLRDFANDNNVSLLAYYEGLSLIPNFRDSNGKNIFIQTIVNSETDLTGLFCSFNEELVESDYPNGLIDIIGQTIADDNTKEINFLSYKEAIAETISFDNKPLDLPGNVIGMISTISSEKQAYDNDAVNIHPKTSGKITNYTRTSYFIDDMIFNTKVDTANLSNAKNVFDLYQNTKANILALTSGLKLDTYYFATDNTALTDSFYKVDLTDETSITATGDYVAYDSTNVAIFKTIDGVLTNTVYTTYVNVNAATPVKPYIPGTYYKTTDDSMWYATTYEFCTPLHPPVSYNAILKTKTDNSKSLKITSINNVLCIDTIKSYKVAINPIADATSLIGYYFNDIANSTVKVTTDGRTLTTPTVSQSVSFNIINGAYAYAVINENYISLNSTTTDITTTYKILASDFQSSNVALYYRRTYCYNTSGNIVYYDSSVGSTTLSGIINPNVASTDIVIGYVTIKMLNGIITEATYNGIYIDVNGYIYLKPYVNLTTAYDYKMSLDTDNKLIIEFSDTANVAKLNDYKRYRSIRLFNKLVSVISSSSKNKITLNLGKENNYDKYLFENTTISNIITSSTINKSFTLSTTLTYDQLNKLISDGNFVLYIKDNENILGSTTTVTSNVLPTKTNGVISKYSDMYLNYYDGIINTGDYFYGNILLEKNYANITFDTASNTTDTKYTNRFYIIFSNVNMDGTQSEDPAFQLGTQVIIPQSTLNSGVYTITDTVTTQTTTITPKTLAENLGYADVVVNGVTTNYWAYEVVETVYYETLFNIDYMYDYNSKIYLKMYIDDNNNLQMKYYSDNTLTTQITDLSIVYNPIVYVQSSKSNYKQTVEIEIPSGYVQSPNSILINSTRYPEIKVGDYLAAYYDESTLQTGEMPRKMTRILKKRAYSADSSLTEITCDARIKKTDYNGVYQTTRYASIDNYISTYKAITLKGFRIRQASLPDGSDDRQTEILNMVASGTPLFKALCNQDAIDFRYVIDSFGLGLTENSKQQLVDICGNRLDCFGFINMPSIKTFKNSVSPTFVDSDGVVQTKYIAEGGNPEDSPAFLYSFGTGKGTTAVGYFLPYLTILDNGRRYSIPPAAWVATTYMNKQNSTSTGIVPWTIAAGITNGKISNINGVEMTFTLEDIENLNSIGHMNPIVYKRNRGYMIETENTAQTAYVSSLSYIHCREVLIELERDLKDMLLDYQWKFNTADVRAEIKLKADTICDTYVSKNGLYNYFNKMDDENNTSEIIDNQMGVIDTYVECIKGMGIIVNNMTILRNGAIQAGGFIE